MSGLPPVKVQPLSVGIFPTFLTMSGLKKSSTKVCLFVYIFVASAVCLHFICFFVYIKGGLRPEQALQWGTYDVAYVAYDGAGNTAQCDFKIYVLKQFCPPLDPPENGIQECKDWGPGGRFKTCEIFCDNEYEFSQNVPKFYTCGAEGFWRPNLNPDPTSPFVYPACTRSSSAQKVFKIKLDYITEVLCNDAGKGVLKQNILEALQALNKEWNFVDDQQVSNCNKIAI